MVPDKAVREIFAVDAANLSRFTTGKDAPIWWGIVGLILIEITVVTVFSTSCLYLQMVNETWPPASTEVPDLLLPTLSLIIMLISCITMWLAGRAINENSSKRFAFYTAVSVLMAGVVLLIRWQKFQKFEFRWDENAYASMVWILTGFHFLHVVSAAIGTAVISYLGMLGFYNKDRQIGVVVDTLYWNFVAVAWIPLYFVLYWAPRLF